MREDRGDISDPEDELRRRLAEQFTPGPAPMEDPGLKMPAMDIPSPVPAPPPIQTQDRTDPGPAPRPEPPAPVPPPPAPQPTPTPAPPPAPTPQPAPSPSPQPAAATTEATKIPATGLRPGPNGQFIIDIFKQQGKTPTQNDLDYWEAAIGRANGDLGYIKTRMLQPDTGGQATAGGQLNQQQALDYLKSRYGLALTPAQIQQAYQKFGGDATTSTTTGMLDQVAQYFKSQTGPVLNTGNTNPGIQIGGTGTTGTGGPGGTGGPQGLWGPDFMAQVRKLLMERLQGASGPVDENSPNIASAMTAARDEASRGTEKERSQLAERLYAQGGLNTEAIGRGIQQSSERNAVGLGGLRATLIQKEVEGRRGELQNLLQLALQSGDAEMTNAIRIQLSELDAQLRREGYGVDMAKYMAYLNQIGNQSLIGAS